MIIVWPWSLQALDDDEQFFDDVGGEAERW